MFVSFTLPSGVYVSRYADLLQPNPLEAGATGDVIVFKIIKVHLSCIFLKDYLAY